MKKQLRDRTTSRNFTSKKEKRYASSDPIQDLQTRSYGFMGGGLVTRAMPNPLQWPFAMSPTGRSRSALRNGPLMMTRADAALLPASGMGGSTDYSPTQQPMRTWTLDDDELLRILTRFVGRLAPNWFGAEEREELFQETCLRLTRLGNDFTEGQTRKFSSSFLWQTTTYVRNELMRKHGSRSRNEISFSELQSHNSDEDDSAPFDPATDGSCPEQSLRGSEIGRHIRACLQHLSEDQRRAVTLRLMGFSYREIAQRFGWSETNADNHISRGLKRLRMLLRDKEFQK